MDDRRAGPRSRGRPGRRRCRRRRAALLVRAVRSLVPAGVRRAPLPAGGCRPARPRRPGSSQQSRVRSAPACVACHRGRARPLPSLRAPSWPHWTGLRGDSNERNRRCGGRWRWWSCRDRSLTAGIWRRERLARRRTRARTGSGWLAGTARACRRPTTAPPAPAPDKPRREPDRVVCMHRRPDGQQPRPRRNPPRPARAADPPPDELTRPAYRPSPKPAPAVVQHVRQPHVHDVPLVDEPGLLHHPPRRQVVRKRERDDLAKPERFEPDLDARERKLGGEPLPPPLGHDRPGGLDVVEAGGVGVLEPPRPTTSPVSRSRRSHRPKPWRSQWLGLRGEAVDDLGLGRRRRPGPQRGADPGIEQQPALLGGVLGPQPLAAPAGPSRAGRACPCSSRPCPPIAAASSSSAAWRSSHLISSGSPRSGNGISIESKSRGSTVRGKIARASSRSTLTG